MPCPPFHKTDILNHTRGQKQRKMPGQASGFHAHRSCFASFSFADTTFEEGVILTY
jgi:hypothetical protein